jgi:hypothetical protein
MAKKFTHAACPTCGSPRSIVNGAWLRQQREAQLSLRELGARLNYSAVYLSDVERGRRNFALDMKRSSEVRDDPPAGRTEGAD